MADIDTISTPSSGSIPYQSQSDYQTPSRNGGTPWKDSRGADALRGAAAGLSAGSGMIEGAREQAAANSDRQTPMYHKGGTVRKTGGARLLKGELVIPKSKARKVKRLMKNRSAGRKGSR